VVEIFVRDVTESGSDGLRNAFMADADLKKYKIKLSSTVNIIKI